MPGPTLTPSAAELIAAAHDAYSLADEPALIAVLRQRFVLLCGYSDLPERSPDDQAEFNALYDLSRWPPVPGAAP